MTLPARPLDIVDPALLEHAIEHAADARQALLALLDGAPLGETIAVDRYWNARAPGTPLSRRQAATHQYLRLLEAHVDWEWAQARVPSAALSLARECLDGPVTGITVNRVSTVDTQGLHHPLHGALVFSQDAGAAGPLLFNPAAQPALVPFADRPALDAWLAQHAARLWPDVPQASLVVWAPQPGGAQEGFTTWLDTLRRRATAPAFSTLFPLLPPSTPATPDPDRSVWAPGFGHLPAHLPAAQREAMIQLHLDAYETLLGDHFIGDHNVPAMRNLQALLARRLEAQTRADTAIGVLLDVNTPQALTQLDQHPHYPTLLQARRDALKAEADIQLALSQITAQEHQYLSDDLAGSGAATLALTLPDGSEEPLTGVVLVGPTAALANPSSTDSVLLYWPGMAGGLQRFASRAVLAQALAHGEAPGTTLRATTFTGEPAAQSLDAQRLQIASSAQALLLAHPQPDDAQGQALGQLCEASHYRLQVPRHDARDSASAHLLMHQRSEALRGKLPGWLDTLPLAERKRWRDLLERFLRASDRAQALHEREVPERDRFARARLQARLRQDFTVSGALDVSLNLPVEVIHSRRPVPTLNNAPRYEEIRTPSQARMTLSLEALSLLNIDTRVAEQLDYQVVIVAGGNEAERATVKAGLTKAYLITLVRELNMASAYANCVRNAYWGTREESAFQRQYRHECLSEPVRLMLQLHSLTALRTGRLDAIGQALLERAIDAPGTAPVQLVSLYLAPHADTQQRKGTVSGVVFIVDPATGQTLLYLADFNPRKTVRAFVSLTAARQALFDDLLDPHFIDYLADRVMVGDKADHTARLFRAYQDRDDQVFMLFKPTTNRSLTDYLVSQQLARWLHANSQTSRSNHQIDVEAFLFNVHNALLYTRMALGMMPLVGTLIQAYDSLQAVRDALLAFHQGNDREGRQHVHTVLESLADALMTLAPGAHGRLPRRKPGQWRAQARRLRHAPPHRPNGIGPAAARPFAGYEHPGVLDFAGASPGTHGRYRQVYRLAAGEFIVRHGQAYQVRWDDAAQTWRLSGTATRTYRQPITLDADGEWDTHGAVTGKLLDGGLAGGSPRDDARRLKDLERRHGDLVDTVNALPSFDSNDLGRHVTTEALYEAARRIHTDLIDGHRGLEDLLRQIKELSRDRNRRSMLLELQRDANTSVSNWLQNLLHLEKGRLDRLMGEVRIAATALNQTPDRLDLVARIRDTQQRMLPLQDSISVHMAELADWARREQTPRPRLVGAHQQTLDMLNDRFYRYRRIDTVLDLTHALVDDTPAGWEHLVQLTRLRERFTRAVRNHDDLQDLLSPRQQRQIFTTCLNHVVDYQDFIASTSVLYPEYYDLTLYPRAMQALDTIIESYRLQLARLDQPTATAHPARPSPTKPQRPSSRSGARRAFETPDHLHYVAEEVEDSATLARYTLQPNERLYTLDGANNAKEHWAISTDGRGRHLNPTPQRAAQVRDRQRELEQGQALLKDIDRQIQTAEGYINYSPRNLEHTYQALAQRLRDQAKRVRELAPEDSLIESLTTKASDLDAAGLRRRLQTTLTWATPQAGDLDFLLAQGRVAIVDKGRLPGGVDAEDFVVEYEIRDLGQRPPRALWYAHFHYPQGATGFEGFTVAHIKLARQRSLGRQWQAAQGNEALIHRGALGRAQAEQHFKPLFNTAAPA